MNSLKVPIGSIHSRIRADKCDVTVLGQQIQFRNGRVPNRFLKAALTERISSWDPVDVTRRGIPSRLIINLYDKWGHGKFGMILTGNVCVDPNNLESAGNAVFCKENDSAELRKACLEWSRVMRQDGALAIVQLSHAGRQTPETLNPHPFSCSDVQLMVKRRFMGFGKPIPLTVAQIKSEFMSPRTNKRTDMYGGSPENRMRVIIEIFEAIRREIDASTGFLVGIKTNSVEFQEDGLCLDDAKIMCGMMEELRNKFLFVTPLYVSVLEECGFDFVELSGGTIEKLAFQHMRDSTRKREAFFLEFAEKIRPTFKKTVVYVTGGFRTAPAMVSAVVDGTTDGIGLGRPITAEPDLPAKILRGECSSAADTKLDQNDFAITSTASNTQMGQMGKRRYAEVENIIDDVADLSHPEEVENFKKAAQEYFQSIAETAERHEPIYGVMDYKNILA